MLAERFRVEPGFVDTASAGAPPQTTVDAMQEAIATWAAGHARPQDYDAAIVRLDDEGVAERLLAAGPRVSTRAGAARLSFHLCCTQADVERALEALA